MWVRIRSKSTLRRALVSSSRSVLFRALATLARRALASDLLIAASSLFVGDSGMTAGPEEPRALAWSLLLAGEALLPSMPELLAPEPLELGLALLEFLESSPRDDRVLEDGVLVELSLWRSEAEAFICPMFAAFDSWSESSARAESSGVFSFASSKEPGYRSCT